MPKSRSSNTISRATNSNGGTNENHLLEMARRLTERLSNSTTVDVLSNSSSRNRSELLRVTLDPNTLGQASVTSNSSRTYNVNYNDNSCNCMDHRIRGRVCRHIVAVHHAIGRVVENPTESGASIGNPAYMSNEMQQAVVQFDINEENERRRNQGFYDDEFFYSELGQDEFNSLVDRAKNWDLPYEYENVLNGSQNTFGIELEFVGGNADAIAEELYRLDICSHPYRVGYHSQGIPGKWKLERDGTVSSGIGGGELVSPILTDTRKTWEDIEKICEVAKRHGAKINQKCGGHIHLGISPLDTARQRWRRFFRSIGGFEDVIYRLSGGNLGRIRSNYRAYATPFSEQARMTAQARFTLNDSSDIEQLAQMASNRSRYYGINLTNIYQDNRPDTVEFRYFNGSLDPKQIQANVKIANGILMAAEKARTQSTETSPSTDSMQKRGHLLQEHFSNNNSSGHSSIKKFLDIMFTRKSDKDTVLAVYAKNQWAS